MYYTHTHTHTHTHAHTHTHTYTHTHTHTAQHTHIHKALSSVYESQPDVWSLIVNLATPNGIINTFLSMNFLCVMFVDDLLVQNISCTCTVNDNIMISLSSCNCNTTTTLV